MEIFKIPPATQVTWATILALPGGGTSATPLKNFKETPPWPQESVQLLIIMILRVDLEKKKIATF